MADWDMQYAPDGQTFYVNRVTGETSWEPPAVSLPPNWITQYTPEGVPYYANTMTGETTWEPPKAAPPPARAPAPVARAPITPARTPITPSRTPVATPAMPGRQPVAAARPPTASNVGGWTPQPARPMAAATPARQPVAAPSRQPIATPAMPGRQPVAAAPGRAPAAMPGRGPMGGAAGSTMNITERFYHDQISREVAEEKIQGRPAGTFLIRKSSKPSYVCCSYVDLRNDIQHLLIEFQPGKGFRVEAENSDNIFYPSLTALVAGHADMFKYPVSR